MIKKAGIKYIPAQTVKKVIDYFKLIIRNIIYIKK